MTRLMLLGVAGMDWAGFETGTRSAGLPQLAALRARGAATWLSGAPATDGPAAWASIATGLQPEAHGVWRTQEAWPGGLRPIGRASWRAPPVWSVLAAAGVETGSVAWPAIRPGADWPGVHIDGRFAIPTGPSADAWALPLGCLPDALRRSLRLRRLHPSQVGADMLAPFVPDLQRLDAGRDDRIGMLASGLAQAATIQSAAGWLLQEAAAQAMFVHHPWLHQARLAFERLGRPYHEAVPAAWRFVDALIGALAQMAGRDTLILLVSAGWRGSPGVVLAAGPGVTASGDPWRASVLDIAPTILGRFGLADAALPGRTLPVLPCVGVPRAAPAAPGPPPPEASTKADRAMIFALRRQGYHPPARPGAAWQADGLAELALMVLERDPAEALRIAEAALRRRPGHVMALRLKVRALVALGREEDLPATAEMLLKAAPERGWGALAHGAFHALRNERALAAPWLETAEADPDVGTLTTAAALWLAIDRPGAALRVFGRILALDPDNVPALIGQAMGARARRDFRSAEAALLKALDLDPGRWAIHLQLAHIYARTGRRTEAAGAAAEAVRMGAGPALAADARAGRLKA